MRVLLDGDCCRHSGAVSTFGQNRSRTVPGSRGPARHCHGLSLVAGNPRRLVRTRPDQGVAVALTHPSSTNVRGKACKERVDNLSGNRKGSLRLLDGWGLRVPGVPKCPRIHGQTLRAPEERFKGGIYRCTQAPDLREVVRPTKRLVVPTQVALHRLFRCLLRVEDDIVCQGWNRGQLVSCRAQVAGGFDEPRLRLSHTSRIMRHRAFCLPGRWWQGARRADGHGCQRHRASRPICRRLRPDPKAGCARAERADTRVRQTGPRPP